MKPLVLVLGCRSGPYPALIRMIERTWGDHEPEGTSVLFYYGGDIAGAGRHIVLPVPDDLAHVGQKTLAAFEHVLQRFDFDVVFRTNCSSYVDLPNLHAYLATHGQDRGLYAGVVGAHDGVLFASGSGYFLSRDLVDLVVRERAAWNHSVLDDVALGAVLARHGITPAPTPRRDFRSVKEARDVDTTQFHFRCRAESSNRLEDAQIMLEVHRAFAALRGWKVVGRGPANRVRDRLSFLAPRLFGRVELRG